MVEVTISNIMSENLHNKLIMKIDPISAKEISIILDYELKGWKINKLTKTIFRRTNPVNLRTELLIKHIIEYDVTVVLLYKIFKAIHLYYLANEIKTKSEEYWEDLKK